MALGFDSTLRNNRLNQITSRAGGSALLRIYSGSRPATAGAAVHPASSTVQRQPPRHPASSHHPCGAYRVTSGGSPWVRTRSTI